MNQESEYSNLYSFLASEFAEADLEEKTDQEVIENCVNCNLNQWYCQVIQEGKKALNSDSFCWDKIGDYANRYFLTEADSKEWLTRILTQLELQIKS
jgi:hypothetical protein